jgi:hypothetical protein
MHIVTDGQGNYAVRKFSLLALGYEYLDLEDRFWWSPSSRFFMCCWSPNINLVKSALGKYKPKLVRRYKDTSPRE